MSTNKAKAISLLFLLIFSCSLTQCSGSKRVPKKCDGKKGVRTPMGVL